MDLVAVGAQIRELKAAGNTVIVVFHGGREHVPVPPPYVVHDLRAIADLGADLVIGHHPHVPQGIELHHGVPIAYSLGNFAFHFATDAFYQHVGYVLCVDFAGGRVVGVEAVPYLIEPSGLRRLTGSARAAFTDGLIRATAALDDDESIRAAWDAVVDHYTTPDAAETRLARGAEAVAAGDLRGMAAAANLFFTPAHSELMSRGLRRLSTGQAGASPAWARELLTHYLEFPISTEG
jgi:poly-gamma-glutamate synthesis protein (capsule biosynthesis protein)